MEVSVEELLPPTQPIGEVREGDVVTFDADETSDGLIILQSQPAIA